MPACASTAMRRFSRTDNSGKISVIWKVRAIPMPTRSVTLARVMACPSSRISPWVGGKNPEIMLKNVVFPAPFGPIMARSSPCATVIDTPCTARRLPKCLLRSRTSSIADPLIARPSAA